ncbi:hypothetical protein PoB_003578200 [Plakobranchus ocellatus]|uniref:Uncharacterized protein n=1 Tax=Plakobranchus ocellatus TaxID=259542 RepID=A0AAV4APQ6_9GAST|nr:hypothetical protein PoB_003578200 [Plakobranchus ocellatus]
MHGAGTHVHMEPALTYTWTQHSRTCVASIYEHMWSAFTTPVAGHLTTLACSTHAHLWPAFMFICSQHSRTHVASSQYTCSQQSRVPESSLILNLKPHSRLDNNL